MIIGNELAKLVEGMTIDVDGNTVGIKHTFDDQYALEKFIKELDSRSLAKFPMIFFVTSKVTGERLLSSKREIVIMTNTNPDWLSKDRTANTYTKVIQPIYEKLIPLIDKARPFKIKGDRQKRIEFIDKTNYGIVNGGISKATSKASVVTDYVDARTITLELEYNINC
ncbi:MAG: hypothetical protein ACPGRW_06160 [Flavobacteriaceae bacterium]